MLTSAIACAALSICAVSPAAFGSAQAASSSDSTDVASNHPFVHSVMDAFVSVDTNRDNAITFDEYRSLAFAAFAEADSDGSLTLTLNEVGADPGDRATFAKIDRDVDGVVTLSEFMRMQRLLFDFNDLNLDGSLSPDEYLVVALASRFDWKDSDGDHRLNSEEFAAVLTRVFQSLDIDHSMTLSHAEYSPLDPMTPASANPDGSLSLSSFIDEGLRRLPSGIR